MRFCHILARRDKCFDGVGGCGEGTLPFVGKNGTEKERASDKHSGRKLFPDEESCVKLHICSDLEGQ